jgi:hypothetical protein
MTKAEVRKNISAFTKILKSQGVYKPYVTMDLDSQDRLSNVEIDSYPIDVRAKIGYDPAYGDVFKVNIYDNSLGSGSDSKVMTLTIYSHSFYQTIGPIIKDLWKEAYPRAKKREAGH